MKPRPMHSAPRDHTIIRLLVDYSQGDGWAPLEDENVSWTIGFNGFDHHGEDRWQFVGWCWQHDVFVDASDSGGRPIGWLPFHPGSE